MNRSVSEAVGLRFAQEAQFDGANIIPSHSVHVWHSRASTLDLSIAHLHAHERLRAERFLNDSAKRQYVAGRLMLSELFSRYLKISTTNIEIGSFGKPYLKNSKMFFNISHSVDVIAIAISMLDVGIDIEAVGGRAILFEPLEEHFLTHGELLVSRSGSLLNREEWLRRQWVRKEAVLKGIGRGFYCSPTTFEIIENDDSLRMAINSSSPAAFAQWIVTDVYLEDAVCALAAKAGTRHFEIKCFEV